MKIDREEFSQFIKNVEYFKKLVEFEILKETPDEIYEEYIIFLGKFNNSLHKMQKLIHKEEKESKWKQLKMNIILE